MFTTPHPINEPILGYAPGSAEKTALKAKLAELGSSVIEIPLVIGGKEVRTGKTIDVTSPHDHRKVLAKVHQAGPAEVKADDSASLTSCSGSAAPSSSEKAEWQWSSA